MTKSSENIPPFEQIYLLNSELILHADELSGPVITVGGQAVYYWFIYYLNEYPENQLPNEVYLYSVDVDYVSKRSNVRAIAKIFNVEAIYNDPLELPSLAICSLIDKDTFKIKEFEGRLFTNPDANYTENLIDIIDRPAGFSANDLCGKSLELFTEMFWIRSERPEQPPSHPFVRVLNPISCIRSRLANILNKVKSNIEVEVHRIKSLMIPTFYFLLDKLDTEPFKISQAYVKSFAELVWINDYRRLQIKLGIPLYKILEQLQIHLAQNRTDYELPDMFIDRELVRLVNDRKAQYLRLQRNTCKKDLNMNK
ncbi:MULTISPECIES: hypothetical protein [Providencia]|uniref:hypothetical protein n=1 Tax=Providencia TaxID=586 RepID=UPI00234A4AFC|nr:hypothetical protein [Providencia sp. PROV266]